MTDERRSYDNTRRRQQAAETRRRIVAAGAELVHGSSIRDWRNVTIRAVADRARVNPRTVYRHFGNERGLRDAVMQRLQQEAGVDLEALELEDVTKVAAKVLDYVSAYPPEPKPGLDPTLSETERRRRDALLRAVSERTPGWSERDRRVVAAVLGLLWSLRSYEHLHLDWELERDDAIAGITWVIGLVEDAVRADRPPEG